MVNFRVADFKMPETTADFPALNRASVSLHLNEAIIGEIIHRLSVVDKFCSCNRGSLPHDISQHPLQLPSEEGDRWAVRASMGQKLLSVPRFDQVVVGVNGAMARIRTVHPLDFARIKRQLAQDINRDPLKKTKDVAQADMVENR